MALGMAMCVYKLSLKYFNNYCMNSHDIVLQLLYDFPWNYVSERIVSTANKMLALFLFKESLRIQLMAVDCCFILKECRTLTKINSGSKKYTPCAEAPLQKSLHVKFHISADMLMSAI